MRIILLIITLVALSGCGHSKNWFSQPNLPYLHGPDLDKLPVEYKEGWEDGCSSGMSVYGSSYYKAFYKFRQNIELMGGSKYYKNAWLNAYNYCRHHAESYQWFGYFAGESSRTDSISSTDTTQLKGFSFPWWDGANTPGWGETSWGGSVDESEDWMGYPNKDLLGYDN